MRVYKSVSGQTLVKFQNSECTILTYYLQGYLCVYELSLTSLSSAINWDVGSVHFSDVTISAVASQLTGISSVYSTVCSGAHKRKKTITVPRHYCEGNSPVTGGFPSQRTSNAENVPFDDVIISYNKICWSVRWSAPNIHPDVRWNLQEILIARHNVW